MGDCNACLEPADVDAIHALFPATHLVGPTQDDVNDTTHAPFVRTFREVEMRQVTEVHANARQHGPDDGRASAALGLVLVTKKLMGVKSARGAKKLTMVEFNDRTSMLERKAWDEIRALIDAAASPAESRVPATAQGHVDATVTQAQRAMAKAKLGQRTATSRPRQWRSSSGASSTTTSTRATMASTTCRRTGASTRSHSGNVTRRRRAARHGRPKLGRPPARTAPRVWTCST